MSEQKNFYVNTRT